MRVIVYGIACVVFVLFCIWMIPLLILHTLFGDWMAMFACWLDESGDGVA